MYLRMTSSSWTYRTRYGSACVQKSECNGCIEKSKKVKIPYRRNITYYIHIQYILHVNYRLQITV